MDQPDEKEAEVNINSLLFDHVLTHFLKFDIPYPYTLVRCSTKFLYNQKPLETPSLVVLELSDLYSLKHSFRELCDRK